MGANSKIEWCDHTFNPWIGCTKVSAGCANCYAEAQMDKRLHQVQWGENGTRRRTSPVNWSEPIKWDMAALLHGKRARVFCASIADVFENRPELVEWRRDLFELIAMTPNLDWLLLTKRPETAHAMMLAAIEELGGENREWPWSNIWIGTSVENQEQADKRIPELLKIPAKVRFLSMEPLLGPVDISKTMQVKHPANEGYGIMPLDFIHWVIVGGESGRNARPMHPDWARSIRDQCQAAGVPFLFKQWGEFAPNWLNDDTGNMIPGSGWIDRMGKHAAGRELDGRTWDEVPEVQL